MNVDAVLTFIVVGGLLLFFYGPWQTFCTDFTRQLLFEQRDHLFDIAFSGRISFDDPSYIMMRKSIETLIRFAHVMSAPRILYLAFVFRDVKTSGSGLRDAAAAVDNAELRADLSRVATRTAVIVTGSILMRSIFLFSIVPWAILIALGLVTFVRCRVFIVRQVKLFGDLVQREAELTS